MADDSHLPELEAGNDRYRYRGELWLLFASDGGPGRTPKLRASLALNGFVGRTQVVEAAAGAVSEGSVRLYAAVAEPKNATIVDDSYIADPKVATISSVPLWTADVVEREFGRVDFLKIDAEGAEENIISGLRPILAKHSPDLVVEFNAPRYQDAGRFLAEISSFYAEMCFVGHSGRLEPIGPGAVLTQHVGEDWLLYFRGKKQR